MDRERKEAIISRMKVLSREISKANQALASKDILPSGKRYWERALVNFEAESKRLLREIVIAQYGSKWGVGG